MEDIRDEIVENIADGEYINIAKFAEMAGVTKQAVYQRLNKDLLNYVKVDGKIKMISTAALPLFSLKLNSSERSIKASVEQEVEQESVKLEQENVQVESDNLKLIEYFKGEVERLNRKIEEKDNIIAKKDEIIIGYANKFAALAEREQQLTLNAQQLHAQSLLDEPVSPNDAEDGEDAQTETVEEKPSFWGRLFKKSQKNP